MFFETFYFLKFLKHHSKIFLYEKEFLLIFIVQKITDLLYGWRWLE